MITYKENKLAEILFVCILLSLLPIFLSNTFLAGLSTNSRSYQAFVGAMFLTQPLLILSYLFLSSKRIIVDTRLLLFTFFFTITQLITIYISSSITSLNYLDIIDVLARFISLFIFLVIPSKLSITKTNLQKLMSLVVFLGLVAGLYNMVINYEGIRNIMSIDNPYAVNFTSFYFNRNSFAQLLLIATIANTFIFIETKNKFNLFCYFIFFINIFASFSRTVMLSAAIFFIVLFLTYSGKKPIANKMFGLMIIIGLIIFFNYNLEVRIFFIDKIIRSDSGTSGRAAMWTTGVDILNDTNWLFGVGYISGIDIVRKLGYSLTEFHSFYMESLIGGGLVDLGLHAVIFIYAATRVRVISRNDRKVGAVYVAAHIAFLFYGLVESISFFSMGYVGTLFTIFIITSPLLYANNFMLNQSASGDEFV